MPLLLSEPVLRLDLLSCSMKIAARLLELDAIREPVAMSCSLWYELARSLQMDLVAGLQFPEPSWE